MGMEQEQAHTSLLGYPLLYTGLWDAAAEFGIVAIACLSESPPATLQHPALNVSTRLGRSRPSVHSTQSFISSHCPSFLINLLLLPLMSYLQTVILLQASPQLQALWAFIMQFTILPPCLLPQPFKRTAALVSFS